MYRSSEPAASSGGDATKIDHQWEFPEFRRLLDALPAGAYTCDAQGLITYYNRQAVQLWGREPRLSRLYCLRMQPIQFSA